MVLGAVLVPRNETGVSMKAIARACSAAIASLAATALSMSAHAADLPQIKVSDANKVPECATPGRLMAFLDRHNPKLDEKFSGLATEYMRHGEQLGLRWDTAFFQMLVETGYLTYKGDVKPAQNNFAGLGATGGGVRGESFKDVSTGARAHLEHVLMYSGQKIENPVAERTRNIQDWAVLTNWQKTIKGPMTFAQLTKQWAPTSRSYPRDIASVAGRFYDNDCTTADPKPELLAQARGTAIDNGVTKVAAAETEAAPAGKGAELAKQSIEEARKSGEVLNSGLGAGDLAKVAAATLPVNREAAGPAVKILNPSPVTDAPAVDAARAAAPESEVKPLADVAKPAIVETAALTGAAKVPSKADAKPEKPATTANSKCKVWTASYGGAKAIVIKAGSGSSVNYTVLDVNEGSEKKEADAYITAYAKGGETVGEFSNQTQALDKAFELCPEG
jgi:Mannosyl-glycoprotein endo-beta-N-acetylglucosaminidase